MTNPLIAEAEKVCEILRIEFPGQTFTVKAFSESNVKIFGNANTAREWAVCAYPGFTSAAARDTAEFLEQCERRKAARV